jgi:hypothetical protein
MYSVGVTFSTDVEKGGIETNTLWKKSLTLSVPGTCWVALIVRAFVSISVALGNLWQLMCWAAGGERAFVDCIRSNESTATRRPAARWLPNCGLRAYLTTCKNVYIDTNAVCIGVLLSILW